MDLLFPFIEWRLNDEARKHLKVYNLNLHEKARLSARITSVTHAIFSALILKARKAILLQILFKFVKVHVYS